MYMNVHGEKMRPEWARSQKSKISKKPRPRRPYALRLKVESSAILSDSGALLLRFLAESNRRKRFCRPVPNHSAKEPCVVCACKVTKFLPYTQACGAKPCARGGIKSKMRISERRASYSLLSQRRAEDGAQTRDP